MTTGGSLRLLLGFMVPLLIGNVFQQLYSIADIIIVGRVIGVNALAAVGAAAPVFMLLVGITIGMSNGFTVITGQYYGAGDMKNMRRSVAMATMLSLIGVVILDIIGLTVLEPAMHFMNVPDEIFADSASYVAIITYGLVSMMGYNLLAGILRALGDSKTPLYFLIVSTVVNVFLALFFIVYCGWGVPGSAWGIVLAQTISVVLCLVYIHVRLPILHLHRDAWHWDNAFAIEHLRIGIPMACQFSILGIGILLIQSVCNHFGPVTIAGFTAATRVEQLALQPMISFSLAMAVFSAQNYGAHKFDRIRDGVKQCSRVSFAFGLCAALAIYFFSPQIVSVFIDSGNTEVVQDAELYLKLSVPFYFFLSQLFVFRGAVQGMGVAIVPLISSIIELTMRTGAAMYLATMWGYKGVCYASPIAWVASSIFLFGAYRYFIRILEERYYA
jgi:putative MATE family efflux protein